jgi:hypothetical protein
MLNDLNIVHINNLDVSYMNGFKAGAYFDKTNNAIVIAYAGTDFEFKAIYDNLISIITSQSMSDMIGALIKVLDCPEHFAHAVGDALADITVGVGGSIFGIPTFDAFQFACAAAYYNKVIESDEMQGFINQGAHVVTTGHSLGGGLAQAVASQVGCEAVVFNPAAVPPQMSGGHSENISVIFNSEERLTNFSDLFGSTFASGTIKVQDDGAGLINHGIDEMIDEMIDGLKRVSSGKTLKRVGGGNSQNKLTRQQVTNE